MHVLKKKAHHRLYDATDHRYVGPAQVQALAGRGETIHLVDRRGHDVTRRELPRLLHAVALPGEVAVPGGTFIDLARETAASAATWAAGVGGDAARWLADRPAVIESALRAGAHALLASLHLAEHRELTRLQARLRRLEIRVARIGATRRPLKHRE